MPRSFTVWLCAVLAAFSATDALAVAISTVPVGNASNNHDPDTGGLYGGLDYEYSIGATEVTNAQYVEFLNAKAASDPLSLYSANMGSDPRGGITQSGVSGSFTYAVRADMGNKPVNFVSWYDSIRFANWLNNGQGSSSTETGAYTLGALGLGGVPTNGASITREAGAMWFLTSENEWYKAAYFQPSSEGGDGDSYWAYPMGHNTVPTAATANSVGDISNPGVRIANFNNGADWNSLNGNLTTVGTAGPLSESFYGTSDQGGNVEEWNEALIEDTQRGLRGGAYNRSFATLASVDRGSDHPGAEFVNVGFRVGFREVPEPGSAVLAMLVGGLMWALRKRFK